MKWTSDWTGWQQSKMRTTQSPFGQYFVTNLWNNNGKWQAGYYKFGKPMVITSAGEFDTSADARAYCEKIDREAVIIEAVTG